ncbi:MAG: LEA type 2 family protein [Methanoregula sp.]|nr:LEA type 2 family protein [Methanoregula sp.]
MLVKEPIVKVKDVALRSFSLQSLALDVIVSVENPNAFGIAFKSITFDLFYQSRNEWVFLSHSERSQFKINAGTNDIQMPVTVQNTALFTALTGMLLQGEITIRITGVAIPKLLLFAPKMPFSREMTIPLKLPKV